jgi:PKD repeat protein
MKRLLTIFLLCIAACSASAQSSKLSVFYINGIQNTPFQANESAKTLQFVVSHLLGAAKIESIYNPIGFYGGALKPDADSREGCITFIESTGQFVLHTFTTSPKLALAALATSVVSNSSREFTGCLAADLGELATSKINEENYASIYKDNFLIDSSNAGFTAKYATGIKAKAASFVDAYFANEKPSIVAPVLDTFNKVAKAVRGGNDVLIVAHSQGNIIANLAWVKMLATLTEPELKKIRILNVANTSRFSPHSANITHDADFEIKDLLVDLGLSHSRKTIECSSGAAPASCPFAVAAPTLITGLNALSLEINSWDNHNFVAAYLSDAAATRTGVVTTFKNAMISQVASLLQSMLPIPANIAPTAKFVPNTYSGSTSTQFLFANTISGDPDGSIVSFAWNFGDGTAGTGTQVTHTYAAVGAYTVTLTVTDNEGAKGQSSLVVNVTATPQPDLIPSAVTVTPASVQPGGIVNVTWQMANSGNANAAASTTGLRLLSAATIGNGAATNQMLNVPTGALAAGGVANQSQALTIPAGTAPGSYVVVVVADNVANSTLGQSNVANDYARSSAFAVATSSPAATLTTPTVAAGRLNDTGITASQCYQAGSDVLVSCTSAAAVALNSQQDGMVGRDVVNNNNADGKAGFSYTKIGTNGETLATNATAWSCIKDNITGLIWEVKTADGGLRDMAKTYTNYDSTTSPQIINGAVAPTQAQVDAATNSIGFKNAVNATGLCGANDWRLPRAEELQSVIDYGVGQAGPTVDVNWFLNTRDNAYWSSSSSAVKTLHAWIVFFGYGIINSDLRSNSYSLRLVRTSQ